MLVYHGDYEYALYLAYNETWVLHVYYRGCWVRTVEDASALNPFHDAQGDSVVNYNGWA